MEDSKLVELVLEATALKIKAASKEKELSALSGQIQILSSQKREFEEAKAAYLSAKADAAAAAKGVRDLASVIDARAEEVTKLASSVNEAIGLVERFAALASKPHDFDMSIRQAEKGLSQAQTARKELSKEIESIRQRRSVLKSQGIEVAPDTKIPTNLSI
jgi:chromosome segregation ATPase